MPHSVAELQAGNVTLELECPDRMYLNCYVPQLTSAGGVASYFRNYKGHKFASTKDAVETSAAFKRNVMGFAKEHGIPIHRFQKGQRKDTVMQGFLQNFKASQGVVFIGIAQERATVPRTIRRRFGEGEGTIPWIDYTTAMVNFYYFYCFDEDFGPFFIKFCSYFPYGGKLCINGHEYLKLQLARRGIAFEDLDNGLLSCAEPATAQRLADGFDEVRIERFFRKWLKLLPHPFPAEDRKAGYTYRLSILQAEFALTQVWDRPVHGREFFEQVIRDNIDLGRPETVQLIFARKMRKATATDGEVETVSHDNRIGARAFDGLQQPATNGQGQRAAALRFGDRRVQALLGVLLLMSLQIEGFRNRQLRPLLAQMLGLEEHRITQGKMSYDLRRLRLHGLIERIPKSHRYRLTKTGLGVAMFYQRTYSRLLRPALSIIDGGLAGDNSAQAKALQRIQHAMDNYICSQAA